MSPKELQDVLDELKASRASRQRAWENLQEIRWVLKEAAEIELPPPMRKTIDLEGRIVKDGVISQTGDVSCVTKEKCCNVPRSRTNKGFFPHRCWASKCVRLLLTGSKGSVHEIG